MKKRIILMIFALMWVFARADTSVEGDDIVISGAFPVSHHGGWASIRIFPYDTDLSTLNPLQPATILPLFTYAGQQPIEEGGAFAFEFVQKNASGQYKYVVTSSVDDTQITGSYTYSNAQDIEDAIDDINDILGGTAPQKAEDLQQLVEGNLDILNVKQNFSIYDNLVSSNINLSSAYQRLSTTSSISTRDELIPMLHQALLLSALETNNVSITEQIITDYSNVIHPESALMTLYTSGNFKTEVAQKMTGTNYPTPEKYAATLNNKIFVAAINNISSWGEIEAILTTANGLVDVNMSGFFSKTTAQKGQIMQQLAQSTYAGESDFNTALSNLVNAPTSSSSSSSSSTSSSGGGGGGGSTILPKATIEQQVEEFLDNSERAVFGDIGEVDWATEAITFLYKKGAINGVGNGRFEPFDTVTREAFVKMLVLSLGLEASTVESTFIDVPKDHWSSEFISVAVANLIVTGKGENIFGIGDFVTREDAAVMLKRASDACKMELIQEIEHFNDDDDISDYARESVGMLKLNKIINGVGNGNFAPKQLMNRAAASKMIYEFLRVTKGDNL